LSIDLEHGVTIAREDRMGLREAVWAGREEYSIFSASADGLPGKHSDQANIKRIMFNALQKWESDWAHKYVYRKTRIPLAPVVLILIV
jgi:hypothetical protein